MRTRSFPPIFLKPKSLQPAGLEVSSEIAQLNWLVILLFRMRFLCQWGVLVNLDQPANLVHGVGHRLSHREIFSKFRWLPNS